MAKINFLCKTAITKIIIILINCYRYLLSPVLGNNCRFDPSCSLYAEEAIKQHGIFCGSWLALKRILRCHPWCAGGYDPVSERKTNSNLHLD
jgi:hypothetical protein